MSWTLSQNPKPLIERLSLKLSQRTYSLQFPLEAERSEIPIQLPGKPFRLTYKEYSTMGSPCKMVTIKTCLEWSVMRSPPALDVYLLPDFKLQPLLALISYLHCSLGNLAVLFGFIRTLEPCQTSLSGSYTILALTTRETEVPHSLPDWDTDFLISKAQFYIKTFPCPPELSNLNQIVCKTVSILQGVCEVLIIVRDVLVDWTDKSLRISLNVFCMFLPFSTPSPLSSPCPWSFPPEREAFSFLLSSPISVTQLVLGVGLLWSVVSLLRSLN